MAASSFLGRVAAAPISWGVCEVPGWGHQLAPERVLAEMSGLGFTHTELGSAGWLPKRADALRSVLADHGLSLLAAFIPLVLHDADEADVTLDRAREVARLLADGGATYFNTAPVTSDDWKPRFVPTDDEWRHLYGMVGEIERICREHGLTQVVHEHVGCVVETADEVRALLANTDTALVLDTGHLSIGGLSPVEVVMQYPDRIGLVHLKDVRLDVAERLNRGELSLMEAVQAGLFTALGQGDLDLAHVITTLEATGYGGWYVIEQDCALIGEPPKDGEGPVLDVGASVEFLRGVAATRAGPRTPSFSRAR
ncbi:MAG: sugar phosphate isomerase/epimerase [Acidimicrobiia bacterium]|nr:sugar phosphate isomerase/epimerase [Acidimicrobiia bacterium]